MPARDYFTPRAAEVPGSRRLPRLNTEFITCEFGDVVNLAMTGLRVRCAKPLKIGEEHAITVKGFDMTVGPILATVVWLKDGEAGIRFTKAAKEVRKTLSELAMMAREKGSFSADEQRTRAKE